MTSNYLELKPQARTMVFFAYKEKKRGRKITQESFVERFGEETTERYMREILSQHPPTLDSRDGAYHLSRPTETAIRRFMNLF
jgi:hypothetical protein